MKKPPPKLMSGTNLLNQMEGLDVILGTDPETKRKNKRKGDEVMPWKKKNIFFKEAFSGTLQLECYAYRKNVSENILGTLLGIKGRQRILCNHVLT